MRLLAEGELLTAVHAIVDPLVTAARRGYGPLPSMKSDEFLRARHQVQVATLLVVAEAYVAADPHQVIRSTLRSVSHDVHGGDRTTWAALAARTPRELVLAARRRAVTVARCSRPGCGAPVELGHPLPDLTAVECDECARRLGHAE